MLQAHNLSVELDPLSGPLFTNVNFSISPAEVVALMGPNGAGKSTLLRLLLGELHPQSGHVTVSRGTSIAVLKQDLPAQGLLSDVILDRPLLRKRMARLGISIDYLDRDCSTLSPGERMKALLANALAEEPDVLLLDEPTNHLDSATRQWLVDLLNGAREGVLVITHDRAFADAVADRTLWLERGTTIEVPGGYRELLAAKQLRHTQDRAEYDRSRDEALRLRAAAEAQLQKASKVSHPKKDDNYSAAAKPFYNAKAKRMEKRASAIRSRIDQIQVATKPFEPDPLRIRFPTQPMRSELALEVRGVEKAYGDRTLFRNLSFQVGAGERLAIVGPNGAGKTTLVEGILQPELFDSGEIVWGRAAKPGYLSQTRDHLNPESSLVDELRGYPSTDVRTTLGALGLRGDIPTRPIGTLSVGERTRGELARLLLDGVNVLLLDEPTNHLDVNVLEVLEAAVEAFEGTVILVSHDTRIIEAITDRKLELKGGIV